MLNETEIYLILRRFLPEHGWRLLGGQPPGGTNVIPVIELKDDSHHAKGSRGSKKVDLIAYKEPRFLLLELKESRSDSDIAKLRDIVSNRKWRRAFVHALDEKGRWPAGADRDACIESDAFLFKGLGYNKGYGAPLDDFVTFLVSTKGVETRAGLTGYPG